VSYARNTHQSPASPLPLARSLPPSLISSFPPSVPPSFAPSLLPSPSLPPTGHCGFANRPRSVYSWRHVCPSLSLPCPNPALGEKLGFPLRPLLVLDLALRIGVRIGVSEREAGQCTHLSSASLQGCLPSPWRFLGAASTKASSGFGTGLRLWADAPPKKILKSQLVFL
jgi:hypothetical protein